MEIIKISLDLIYELCYTLKVKYALLAQLDRVTGYEPVDRGFESLHAHQRAMLYKFFTSLKRRCR